MVCEPGWGDRSTQFAVTIRSKLSNQGFPTSEDLNLFVYRKTLDAANRDGLEMNGILIDEYPRCIERLESFRICPFQDTAPLASVSDGKVILGIKPGLVLSFQVLKHNAKERYLSWVRDNNNSAHRLEKGFTGYKVMTVPVEEDYRRRGVLIPVCFAILDSKKLCFSLQVDVNGTKEENIETLTKTLHESELWGNAFKTK